MDVPSRIEVAGGTDVVLTWEDGGLSELTAVQLRAACQCATCREPAGRKATEQVLATPESVTIEQASLVGGYAVNFVFGPDHHGTGIYPFDVLRELGVRQSSSD